MLNAIWSLPVRYEEVLLTIFNYISLLRSSLDTMQPYHHDEQTYLTALRFMYAPKLQPEVYARALARGLLAPLPPERLLDGGELVRIWDPKLVRDVLDLLDVSRARVTICTKEHAEAVVGQGARWDKEKWYGTEYFVRKMSEKFVLKVSSIC